MPLLNTEGKEPVFYPQAKVTHLFHYPADTFLKFQAKHIFGTEKDLGMTVAHLPKNLVWWPCQSAAV